MVNHFAPCFWGAPDQQKFVDDLKEFLSPLKQDGIFAGDNLITIGRNLSLLRDERFIEAFKTVIHETNTVGYGIMWRFYMFCWAARTCLRRDGDFVECGVASGSSSAIMCRYLNFQIIPKRMYLYDVWESDSRVDASGTRFTVDSFEFVKGRFSPYQNVELVQGFIPESFAKAAPERIAFLHIDLNNADAEIAALEHLFDRVVPGGIVLFDDYGFSGYLSSKQAEDKWLGQRGYMVAELPTGQGLLIK